MNKIESAIQKILVFYDLFEFPLTNGEVFDNLYRCKATPKQVAEGLKKLIGEKKIGFKDGFYFLDGHEKNVIIRKKRYLASYNKWKLVKKYLWIFKITPFVKMVMVANTLAYSNAKEDGDIDLLIITEKKRMFLVRTYLTFLMWFSKIWRHGNKIKNRFCLSFFLSEDNLNISDLMSEKEDIYLCYWTKWLKTIYATDKSISEKFRQKNNWVKNWLPNIFWIDDVQRPDKKWWPARLKEIILDNWFGDLLERWLKIMQTNKIKKNTPFFDKDGVMASENVLKFHPKGKRAQYNKRWRDQAAIIF